LLLQNEARLWINVKARDLAEVPIRWSLTIAGK